MKKPGRPLAPEERRLWQLITRQVKPLTEARFQAEPLHEEEKPAVPPRPLLRRVVKRLAEPAAPLPLVRGHYAGIDRNTAERFRKGKLPIEGRLDLHGMRRDEAFEALRRFILHHYARQHRCVLIITGKGKGEGQGVLRDALPGWLAMPELAALLLAYDTAPLALGGSGAVLVLLRRSRD